MKLQRNEESVSTIISTFKDANNYHDILLDVSILETAIITYHQIPPHLRVSLSPSSDVDALSSALEDITKCPLCKANPPSSETVSFCQSYVRHVLRVAVTARNPVLHLLSCAALSTKISKVNKRWKFVAGVFYGLAKDGMGGMAGKMAVMMMKDGIDDCGEHEVFSYTSLQASLAPADSVVESVLDKLRSIQSKTATSEIHDEMTVLENDGCLVKASRRDVQREIVLWERRRSNGLEASMAAVEAGDTDWEILKNALADAKASNPPSVEAYLEFLNSKDSLDSKAHRNIKLAILHATHALSLPVANLVQSYYALFGQMEECHLDLSPFVTSQDSDFWNKKFEELKATVESDTKAGAFEGAIRRYYTVVRILLKLDLPVSEETVHKHLEKSVALLGSDPVPDPSLPPPPPPKYRDQRAYDNLTHIFFTLTPPSDNNVNLHLNLYTLARLGLQRSNHNHTLAIRMIREANLLGSLPPTAMAAWNKLEVKQIQLLSISHLVLPLFYKVGMYPEVVSICGDITMVCRDMKRRLGDSAWKCVENGTYRSLTDIMTWWRRKFETALQRFEGKWGVLECGVLSQDTMGAVEGFFGGKDDGQRAELLLDGLDEFLLREVWDRSDFSSSSFSDLRDDVEKEELLESMETAAWRVARGVKVIKLTAHAAFIKGKYKQPKKGKVDKKCVEFGERLKEVCSDFSAAVAANGSLTPAFHGHLFKALDSSALAIVTVTANDPEEKTKELVDAAADGITAATECISSMQNETHGLLAEAFVTTVCTSLTSCIIPLSSILSSLVSVGKKKRSANPARLIKICVAMIDIILEKLGPNIDPSSDFSSALNSLKAEGECHQLVSDEEFTVSYKDIVEGNNLTRERVRKVLMDQKAVFDV